MKKMFIFIVFILFMFPINVFAKENSVNISCDKTEIKNNGEIECEIQASNLNFIVTSISGKIEVSDNLLITDSYYDSDGWKILDSKFNVGDINLISETIELKSNISIATFKIKAVNKVSETGFIKFKNVIFGDDLYEEHNMEIDDISINLTYNGDNIVENPTTGNAYIFVIIFIAILMLGVLIFINRKRIKDL